MSCIPGCLQKRDIFQHKYILDAVIARKHIQVLKVVSFSFSMSLIYVCFHERSACQKCIEEHLANQYCFSSSGEL